MKLRRSDRLVDMTRYMLENPRRLISLTYFATHYDSAKSSISEDLSILKRAFAEKGVGVIETVAGAAGGAVYAPKMSQQEAQSFVEELQDEVNDETRVLPGGYVYLSDILGRPDVLRKIGRLIATKFINKKVDVVMTSATKGIPVAHAVAEQLNVPFVIVRDDAKITEGPTVSVNYLTGSSKRVEKMELSRRSMATGSKVLIVDDFMKAGGTIQGMQTLVGEFDSEVVGTAVFAEGRTRNRLVDDFISLLHVDTNLNDGHAIAVSPGNYLETVYQIEEEQTNE